MTMGGSKALGWAVVPATAGLAWQRYRRALRAVDAHPAVAPVLAGELRQIPTSWGSVAYRRVPGDPSRPAVVLIHGWGKTSDSAWWPIISESSRTMLVVDLPGHGNSRLDERFALSLAADAVERAVDDAGITDPVLVGHSMGGPVALTTLRRTGPAAFAGFVALATSVYWVRPKLRAMMALAPYVMAPRSPFLLRTERAELRESPEVAAHIAWSYTCRPSRRLLDDTAAALRRFDARGWEDLGLPRTLWVVAVEDTVLAPEHQRASALMVGAEMIEVDAHHSLVVQAPDVVLTILEGF